MKYEADVALGKTMKELRRELATREEIELSESASTPPDLDSPSEFLWELFKIENIW
jgi:hypothetical protein